MNLADIKKILKQEDLQLTKSLGQNFLHDREKLDQIVAAAELERGEKVLEIGPGLGPLTRLLVHAGANVLAIEKDARLGRLLGPRFKDAPGFELMVADALDELKKQERDWSDWKVVSNLPYSVASPILVELASSECAPKRIVATLQAEVVKRLIAGPGGKDFGVLSLLVQITYRPESSFAVPHA